MPQPNTNTELDQQISEMFQRHGFHSAPIGMTTDIKRLFTSHNKKLELSAELKQTRRIYQHEIDVYGKSMNESYLKSEIEDLKRELAQLSNLEGEKT